MEVILLPLAKQDLAFWKNNKNSIKKITRLIQSIKENPFHGIGKPELLRYQMSNCWSRRINQEHRIIYEVTRNRIIIYSLKGHYLK